MGLLERIVPHALRLVFPGVASAAALAGCVYISLGWIDAPQLQPPWARTLVSLAAIPLSWYIRALWQDALDRRQMNALGGAPIPVVPAWVRDTPGSNDYLFKHRMKMNARYGTTHLSSRWGQKIVFTADPENMKAILASDFNNFVKGPIFRGAARSVLGTGVFNSDGDMWKFHRTMTRPFFTRERITDFEIFQKHADAAIAKIRGRVQSGIPFNFEDLIARFTLDSSTEFLFGQSVDSLHADLPYPHTVTAPLGYIQAKSASDDFVQAFEDAKRAILERLRSGILWPVAELFGDKSRPAMKVIDAYIDPILQLALERKRINKCSPLADEHHDAHTLLDHLLSSTEDRQIIKDEIMNIMVAGRDTTMSTLTFAVYFLSQHPDVLEKLRSEVLAKFPDGQVPSYEDLREMKYMRAVLNETLRLFPPVPGNIRQNIDGMLLPSIDPKTGKQHYLPPNSFISYSVYIMHRRKDLWGPDAENFDPDRFLDDRLQKYLTPNPFIFLPFNAGPRICLGQQFAYNEMSFFLVRLLQAIGDIKFAPEAQPPESRPPPEWAHAEGRQAVEKIFPMSFLTMFVKGGLWVTMSAA